MTAPAALEAALRAAGLFVSGTCAAEPGDGLPEGRRGIALLSPDEPRFWDIFTASPEYADGAPDPLDRWSRRVIGRIACDHGLKAAFPFGGPPYRPFLAWARRSGRCHPSPVTLLVHDRAGLWISFRGALLLPEAPPPDPRPSPCETCAGRPCLTACPPGALTEAGYDVPACRAHVAALPATLVGKYPGGRPDRAGGQRPPDADCRTGCRVRAACPVGQSRRLPEQSAFHMRAFLP